MSEGYEQYEGVPRDKRRAMVGQYDDARTAGMIVIGALVLLAVLKGGFRKILN